MTSLSTAIQHAQRWDCEHAGISNPACTCVLVCIYINSYIYLRNVQVKFLPSDVHFTRIQTSEVSVSGSFFAGVKRPRRGADSPILSSAKVKNDLYSTPPLCPQGMSWGELYLFLRS